MKTKLMILILTAFSFSMANANHHEGTKEHMKQELAADKTQVNTACAEDAKTANCGDKVVGEGLLKCLHDYKKTNKEFKFSDACKSAMKELKGDRGALRAKRHSEKTEEKK